MTSLKPVITIFQSHYFERSDVALPGLAKWFEKASLEEREHATGLMEYLNKRGADISLENLHVSSFCYMYYTYMTSCIFYCHTAIAKSVYKRQPAMLIVFLGISIDAYQFFPSNSKCRPNLRMKQKLRF